jgi:hypothetical protein
MMLAAILAVLAFARYLWRRRRLLRAMEDAEARPADPTAPPEY